MKTIENKNGLLIMNDSFVIEAGDYKGQLVESKTEVFRSHLDANIEANKRISNHSNLVHLHNEEVVVNHEKYYYPMFNVWD